MKYINSAYAINVANFVLYSWAQLEKCISVGNELFFVIIVIFDSEFSV